METPGKWVLEGWLGWHTGGRGLHGDGKVDKEKRVRQFQSRKDGEDQTF